MVGDTAGMEKMKSITGGYYKNITGIILMFDLANQESFLSAVNYWLDQFSGYNGHEDVIILLVGNKADLN
jgi:GTPase SAR1 family protein